MPKINGLTITLQQSKQEYNGTTGDIDVIVNGQVVAYLHHREHTGETLFNVWADNAADQGLDVWVSGSKHTTSMKRIAKARK